MKVTFSKPKHQRIFKSRYRPFWIEPSAKGWWYNLAVGEWQSYYSTPACSSYYAMERHGFNDVWSLKAAIRLIKKWNVPKGTEFIVSLPYVGHHFIIKT